MDYSGLAARAVLQIRDKGRAANLIYKDQGTYSPSNDTVSGASLEEIEVKTVITNYRDSAIDGVMILTGDRQAVIAANVVKPRIGDILNDQGQEYAIVNVIEIGPGDTPLVYKLQIRR